MKPVTDLVLLPPLELIPIESLPQQRSQELGLLNKERREMLKGAVAGHIATLVIGSLAGLFGLASLLAVIGHESIMLFFLMILCCMIFSVITVYSLLPIFIRDVRAYQQTAIPPQLKIDAEAEMLLSDTARRVNAQIAKWNTAAEGAVGHDVGERYLRLLKTNRDAISARVAQIKKLAARQNKPTTG